MDTRKKTAPTVQNQILIERREVVATVELSPFGELPPVEVAFSAASNWIGEHYHTDPVRLEFEYGGTRWYIGAEPLPANE